MGATGAIEGQGVERTGAGVGIEAVDQDQVEGFIAGGEPRDAVGDFDFQPLRILGQLEELLRRGHH